MMWHPNASAGTTVVSLLCIDLLGDRWSIATKGELRMCRVLEEQHFVNEMQTCIGSQSLEAELHELCGQSFQCLSGALAVLRR